MGAQPAIDMWRITKGCHLLWRKYDEEYVVFNSGSGHTHLLDGIGRGVLRCLEEHPASSQELALEMAEELEPGSAPVITEQIGELLVKFQDLGLVEFIQR